MSYSIADSPYIVHGLTFDPLAVTMVCPLECSRVRRDSTLNYNKLAQHKQQRSSVTTRAKRWLACFGGSGGR